LELPENYAMLRSFYTTDNLQHPANNALAEMTKAIKTILLCRSCIASTCVVKSMSLECDNALKELNWSKRLVI
jgi:TnpA family transposase